MIAAFGKTRVVPKLMLHLIFLREILIVYTYFYKQIKNLLFIKACSNNFR